MGDFNEHGGNSVDGFEGVYGSYGLGQGNKGERILELADSFDIVIGNTCFKKDVEKSGAMLQQQITF